MMRPRRSTGNRQNRKLESSLSSTYDSVFVHRKNALYRRAAELSAITDCEIGIVVLSPDGELSQFTTSSMKKILKSYSKLCSQPHECHTMESIQEKLVQAGSATGIGLSTKRKKKGHSGVQKKKRAAGDKGQSSKQAAKAEVADMEEVDDEGRETVEAILAMRDSVKVSPADTMPGSDGSLDADEEKGSVQAKDSGERKKRKYKDDSSVAGEEEVLQQYNTSSDTHTHTDTDGKQRTELLEEDVEQEDVACESPVEQNADESSRDLCIETPANKKQKPLPPSLEPVVLLGPKNGNEQKGSD
eukprot:jgi/Picsp_1/3130/NSC_05971-R1_myocyte enhancer factor 2d